MNDSESCQVRKVASLLTEALKPSAMLECRNSEQGGFPFSFPRPAIHGPGLHSPYYDPARIFSSTVARGWFMRAFAADTNGLVSPCGRGQRSTSVQTACRRRGGGPRARIDRGHRQEARTARDYRAREGPGRPCPDNTGQSGQHLDTAGRRSRHYRTDALIAAKDETIEELRGQVRRLEREVDPPTKRYAGEIICWPPWSGPRP